MSGGGEERDGRSVRALAAGLAMVGFVAAAFFFSTWHVCVEAGQALAGLIALPSWSPVLRYELGTWTVLNQFCAIGLQMGFSEKTLSIFISGLAGAVWFPAIGLLVHGLTRSVPLAFAAPFLTIFVRTVGFPGVTYGVFYMGQGGTYGVIGLAWLVLVLALLAAGKPEASLSAACLMPAIHPALAVWLGATLGTACLLNAGWTMTVVRRAWPKLVMASGVTLASYLAYVRWSLPPLEDPDHWKFFHAFIRYWDAHRRPFPLWSAAIAEVLLVVAAFVLVLVLARRELRVELQILAISAILMAAAGLGLSSLYWFPPESVPPFLLALMPSRLVNVHLAIGIPLVLGLLAANRRRTITPAALFLVLTVLGSAYNHLSAWRHNAMLNRLVPGWLGLTREWAVVGIEALVVAYLFERTFQDVLQGKVRRRFLGGAAILLAVVCGSLLVGRSVRPVVFERYSLARAVAIVLVAGLAIFLAFLARRKPREKVDERSGVALPGAVWICLAAVSALLFVAYAIQNPRPALVDRTDSTFWRLLSGRQGSVVTGPSLLLVQLRSRRPQLIDAYSLDALPFTKGTGSVTNDILKTVYGVDLLNPTAEQKLRRRGGLLPGDGREIFERRSPQEWRKIAQQYGVTDVIVDQGWKLRLPVLDTAEGLTVYEIGGDSVTR